MKLEKLQINNFKGIENLEIDFKDVTTIQGANRSGKTSIFDAFLWLLTGKTADDKKDFSIKPRSKNGTSDKGIIVSVKGYFDFNGRKIELKKEYIQIWSKDKGKTESYLKTHKTACYFNSDEKLTLTEYNNHLASLFDLSYLKLLTNPFYFNSLKENEKRNILINLSEAPTPSEIYSLMDPDSVRQIKGKNFVNIKHDITELKLELIAIPVRIDEAGKGMPEEVFNFKTLKAEKNEFIRNIENTENKIKDKNKVLIEFNELRQEEQNDLMELSANIQDHIRKVNSESYEANKERSEKITDSDSRLLELNMDISRINKSIQLEGAELKDAIEMKKTLLIDYKTEAKITFDDHGLAVCHYCGADVPEEKMEEHKKSFEKTKASILDKIKKQGLKLKEDIKAAEENIVSLNNSLTDKTGKVEDLTEKLKDIKATEPEAAPVDKTLLKLESEYKEKEDNFNSVKPPIVDTAELDERLANFKNDMLAVDKKLLNEDLIKGIEKRIETLKTSEKEQNSKLATLERIEFCLNDYNTLKIKSIENKVSSKFKHANINLFEILMNGEEKEVCEVSFNGVPYADLNSELKINIGLDIINTLSKEYSTYLPIFIDNSESITSIFPVKSQLIKLTVNKDFETLQVS